MRTTRSAIRNDLEDVLHGDDFASLVVAAFRADAVWLLRLVALRTSRRRLRLQKIVRAAGARSLLTVTAFWVWHRSSLTFSFLDRLLDLAQRSPSLIGDRALALAA